MLSNLKTTRTPNLRQLKKVRKSFTHQKNKLNEYYILYIQWLT
jgi:hypothetical protein